MVADAAGHGELPQQPGDGPETDESDQANPADGNVLLGTRQAGALPGLAHARGGHGRCEAGDHRLDQLDQGPYRGDADGAGADEARLVAPHVGGDVGRCPGGRMGHGQPGHQPAPGDERADQHGEADGQADQVADAEQGHGQAEVVAGDGVSAADAEVVDEILGEDLGLGDQVEHRRGHRTDDQGEQSGLAGLGRFRRTFAFGTRTDLEHLGAGHALRIRQIGIGDQGAAQRDRVHHAEDAAEGADPERDPVGKAGPPADHDQAGQHEDDRGQGAGRRGDGLHHVVFLDGDVLEVTQHRHRDHRRRYGGGEGQAGLEAEEDIGGGEDEGDRRAEDQAADGEFGTRRGAGRIACGQRVSPDDLPVRR